MKEQIQIAFIPWRFYLLSVFILLVTAGLAVRMVDLAVVEQHFLQTQGDARALRTVTEPAFRGMITDRNGYPLAISTSVYSIWINPKEFSADQQSLKSLSKILALKTTDIQAIIQQHKKKGRVFAYLKRGLSPDVSKQIKALALPGVYLQQDFKRFYPEGEVAAHVIGFTNVDDEGQEGMELAYDKQLTGTPGKELVIKDRLGRVISGVQKIQEQKAGSDLTLSINRRIQYLAYRELLDGVQKNIANSGSVVVLDVKTGEILAMVNQPSFNPNRISSQKKDSMRNRAVTDSFEPGSTIKTFTLTYALGSGKFTPDTMIDTSPGWMRVGRHIVHDEHENGMLSVTQILQISSNVGASKIISTLPPQPFWNLLHKMGFGESTGIGFPGEQSGKIVEKQDPFAIATLSFGYGITANTLQLAHAYATIANDGVKIPLSLVRIDTPPQGERVINAKLAREMRQVLESVLNKHEHGTGAPANVPGYHVAGKTGTARIVGPHGYEKHKHVSSFVGMAPATAPRLVVAVVIRNPQGKYYFGGDVSGPVFEKIMEGSLRILNIPPDDVASLQSKKTS